MAEEILGTGLAFPLGVDARGGIALVKEEADVDQALAFILGTAPGERPMRPEFGCGIHEYVFAPIDGGTAGRVAYEVRESLTRWEPRIRIESVRVYPAPDLGGGTLMIEITYTMLGTLDPRTLVFPFYVIPSETPA